MLPPVSTHRRHVSHWQLTKLQRTQSEPLSATSTVRRLDYCNAIGNSVVRRKSSSPPASFSLTALLPSPQTKYPTSVCLSLATPLHHLHTHPTTPPDFSSFTPASESEILKILSNCSNKQSDSDPIPTWLLKECASVLVPTITNIVNFSLTSGQFHHILKESVISPLLKKSTLDNDELSNYRPICNLCVISKIIERVVKSRLIDHLTSSKLLNPHLTSLPTVNIIPLKLLWSTFTIISSMQ